MVVDPHCDDPQCGHGGRLCFRHKMEYWRTEGVPGVSIPKHFRAANEGSYTQREVRDETFRNAAEGGYEIRRAR